ncbi:Zinc finger protein ZIC 5 [Grifola frondosa]|uniref:Zinc finger protein ZIC 5 n=1 Tax=Grifola frondosa TaxID=5627 RepID=A0A1C7MGU8_GRIFR|nr:Zinc finger protein ZIC 5 [Grifola frondosa]
MGNPASSEFTPLSSSDRHSLSSPSNPALVQPPLFSFSSPRSTPSLSTYQHFSALRTTNEQSSPIMLAQALCQKTVDGRCPCMGEGGLAQLDCAECAKECEKAACTVELTSQCTDQCVVVACNDAHHGSTSCVETSRTSLATIFAQTVSIAQRSMNSAVRTILVIFQTPDFSLLTWPQRTTRSNGIHPSTHFCAAVAMDPPYLLPRNSFPALPSDSPEPLLQPSPDPSNAASHSSHLQDLSSPYFHNSLSQTSQPALMQCMWGNCLETFSSLSELVGHVNLQHLRLPSPPSLSAELFRSRVPPAGTTSPGSSQTLQQMSDATALSCLWADCHLYPSAQSIPGPSTGNQLDSALGVLASHLLEDHLGVPVRPPEQQQPSITNTTTATGIQSAPVAELKPQLSTPMPRPPNHCCETFASCDALTAHIAVTHVGGGKAHYDCFWEGCTRNGQSGFASKQKISRHLQSHTGHRPFQCNICNQNFSEAATLAQHMRRHTQEKPYVCDFPGCGKAFAITGALTIHKRTHNGSKPFKCTYCDRAFAESSNLSKHLRTHTGARPYPCSEPGCNKSFARPDQLARHMNVHKKKVAGAGAERT